MGEGRLRENAGFGGKFGLEPPEASPSRVLEKLPLTPSPQKMDHRSAHRAIARIFAWCWGAVLARGCGAGPKS